MAQMTGLTGVKQHLRRLKNAKFIKSSPFFFDKSLPKKFKTWELIGTNELTGDKFANLEFPETVSRNETYFREIPANRVITLLGIEQDQRDKDTYMIVEHRSGDNYNKWQRVSVLWFGLPSKERAKSMLLEYMENNT